MVEDNAQTPAGPARGAGDTSASRTWVRRVLQALLATVILAAGSAVSYYWLTHRPTAQRRAPEGQAALVEVTRVRLETQAIVVRAMGTVVPARLIQLAPRVGGEIVHLSPQFVPGGRFETGDVMVRIDPVDFELAVRRQEAERDRRAAEVEQRAGEVIQKASDVVRYESELAVEMGQQSVAQLEYELLGQVVQTEDRTLILRKPQLRIAQSACEAARAASRSAEGASRAALAIKATADAALDQARLDLQRTTIRAPFNAMVQSRQVNLGSQVSVGAPLATLVGTDAYWVQVSLPVDQLKWIRVPEFNSREGSTVRIYCEPAWGPEALRTGRVARLMTALEPQGRMARLLVTVADPLGLKADSSQRRPLILDSYVRVQIDGQALDGVVRVPRAALRDGQRVWVMTADRTLNIRNVTIAWSGNDHVYASEGLADGDRLITSNLASPVQGMALRTSVEAGDPPGRAPAEQPSGDDAAERRP